MNKYQYKVQGVDYDVEIEEVEGNVAKVNVNGIRFDVELKQPINPTSTQGTTAWYHHRIEGKCRRQGKCRRRRARARGDEDAEQHRVGICRNRHIDYCQTG